MARITFLGTAGDAIVSGKQIRASGGIALEFGEDVILLNPGPGCLVRAKQYGINLRNVTALLVSNNTLLHANDVNAVISSMTHEGLDTKGVLICNKTVYGGNKDNESFLKKEYRDLLERAVVLSKKERVEVNDTEILGLPAKHKDKESLGFRIKTKDVSIIYTADTSFDKRLIKNYENCDILILENVYPSGSDNQDFLNSDQASDIIKKASPNLAIITHFGIKMINADPLYEAREIQKKSGIHVIASDDGLVVDTKSHATSLGR